jgi:hypothetical protein
MGAHQVILLLASLWVSGASAQLRIISEGSNPKSVFGGNSRSLQIVIQNGEKPVRTEVRLILSQAGGGAVAPWGERSWKWLELLPRQTILETVMVEFPAVKAETRFLIQWVEGDNKVFGTTEVMIYPTNLLGRLAVIGGDEAVGVFDPANQLRPILKGQGVSYRDLVEEGTDRFQKTLAIVGPFEDKQQLPRGLSEKVRLLARRGVTVIFFQPAPERDVRLKPSFYPVHEGKGLILVVQSELVLHLGERPEAQSNLIRLAEWARRPDFLNLPETQD